MARPESVVRPQDLGIGRLFETVRDAGIVAEVSDDRRGGDTDSTRADVGLGSTNERAARGGKLESEPGRGVRMRFRASLRNVGEGGKG